MDISFETLQQMQERLLKVIATAQMKVFDETYAFEEFPALDFPHRLSSKALAFVRDEQVWSQLVPSNDSTRELFWIFCFHFPAGLDNSGFVGWLASHLKQKLGTGVFVVCGQNSNWGGIFDYWGCPLQIGHQVLEEVNCLRQGIVSTRLT